MGCVTVKAKRQSISEGIFVDKQEYIDTINEWGTTKLIPLKRRAIPEHLKKCSDFKKRHDITCRP